MNTQYYNDMLAIAGSVCKYFSGVNPLPCKEYEVIDIVTNAMSDLCDCIGLDDGRVICALHSVWHMEDFHLEDFTHRDLSLFLRGILRRDRVVLSLGCKNRHLFYKILSELDF